MPELMSVETEPRWTGQTISRVQCFSDAVVYGDPGNHYRSSDVEIYAMSLIGSEQAIRSIAAGLREKSDSPIDLVFRGKTTKIRGQWAMTKFRHKTVRVGPGTVHMVAMVDNSMSEEKATTPTHLVTVPGPVSASDLDQAIYRALCRHYSTPLIPLSSPEPQEQEAAKVWSRAIARLLMKDKKHWERLTLHPDSISPRWAVAGRLGLTDDALDALVALLCQHGSLPFPQRGQPDDSPSSPQPTSISL